jgi:beta-mannosidase
LRRSYIRKEQQSFSWDFAPPTGTTGIAEPPTLVGYDSALLRDVVVTTRPEAGADGSEVSAWTADVAVRLWSTRGPADGFERAHLSATIGGDGSLGDGYSASQTVTLAVGETVAMLAVSLPVSAGVERWWPNGYGKQPLYNLTVTLVAGGGAGGDGRVSSTCSTATPGGRSCAESQTLRKQVGFRTVRIDQSAVLPRPTRGRSPAQDFVGGDGRFGSSGGDDRRYRYVVNDRPIYVRGSNWVPSQSLGVRVTRSQVERHFEAYKAAHFTNIRVWGGGVYASDHFMGLADRAGIIVTHDFQFGDQFYPTNAGFLANVAAEVRDQAWRLGSHASMAIWCGNNEMAGGYVLLFCHCLWVCSSSPFASPHKRSLGTSRTVAQSRAPPYLHIPPVPPPSPTC